MTPFAAYRNGLPSQALRNPGLKWATSSLLETFALSFVLAGVAGALPMVMYLRG